MLKMLTSSRGLGILILLLLVFGLLPSGASARAVPLGDGGGKQPLTAHRPTQLTGRVLVRFRSGVAAADTRRSLLGSRVVEAVHGVRVVSPSSAGAAALLARLRRDPAVAYA
ncbi:MAG: hypothetical protein M3506_01350, partial [Chloroflexota bacterium]|nr:hypothetical protein [Chloroflexota bacterium]